MDEAQADFPWRGPGEGGQVRDGWAGRGRRRHGVALRARFCVSRDDVSCWEKNGAEGGVVLAAVEVVRWA